MAIKANASSQGSADFKRFIGVGSFRVIGVNPTKEELEKFYGREVSNEPVYLKEKEDDKDGNKKYKQLRVSFMVQADDPSNLDASEKEAIKTNAALTEPLKTTVSFFIDSRYRYNNDKTKVQVIDKYGRTAWVTIEQARNHQIPVYSNGPARLDADYRPCYRGEEALTKFILNYLNVTPIDTYNRNTGEWVTNPHPDDCEGNLSKIKEYFNGNISELKEYSSMMPLNRVKLCVGVKTDNEGKQFMTVYNNVTLRNGARSYTPIKDDLQNNQSSNDTVFSDNVAGIIENIHEYKENVSETNLNKPVDNPFSEEASDLPFDAPDNSNDEDPFAGM